MTTVISVENLSKTYRLGQIGTGTFTYDLALWWAKVRGKPNPLLRIGETDHGNRDGEELWALKDVSFTVEQGEVLGIIGKNGAGKSTLLKILSRVTAPTSGKIKVKGRVASLLEVGTGFHPELTGRENIYLNGAILGMTRQEVTRKFDEIVDFAGVEKFIDTPVKRYSSGMYVRLAFAVAAHLEPEILVVDEVLAVGDAEFQKKCLGKMGEVARGGRTVLFVSHNMLAINSLCTRSLVVNIGQILYQGTSKDAIEQYTNQVFLDNKDIIERKDRDGDGRIRFIRCWIEDGRGNPVEAVHSGQDIAIVAQYVSSDSDFLKSLSVAFALKGPMGERLADLWNQGAGAIWNNIPSNGKVICKLPRLPLNEGRYTFNICSYVNDVLADWITDVGSFHVIVGDFYNSGRLPRKDNGNFLFDQEWFHC